MNSDKTEIEESGQKNTPPLPESKNQLTQLILDIGEQMLICGGEVNRVEETISRLCTAYGALRADVFSITSAIIVTVCWENGEIITQSRRICASGREFNRLEELNELSRYICRTRPAIEEVESRMRKIVYAQRPPAWRGILGSFLAAGGCVVFFGGTLRDALTTMIGAFVIFVIDRYIYNNRMNKVVYYMLCAFVAGVISIFSVRFGIGNNLDKIMIGCIMLVIPGINFTSAMEDVLSGDTATGTLKLYESVLIACAIAGGYAFAVYLCGGLALI